jgi:hypothetical protein
MPRLLLAAATAAILLLALAASPAQAACPVGQNCDPGGNVKAPTTSIATKPSNPTGDTTPDFSFTTSEGGEWYECRWGGAANEDWSATGRVACGSTYTPATPLTAGTYHFYVRACKDYFHADLGDVVTLCDATPAAYSFVLSTTGPAVTFDAKSTFENATVRVAPVYHFTAPGATAYQCAVDAGAWGACVSPFIASIANLSQGEHRVHVRAQNEWGHWGAASTRKFNLDTVGPTIVLDLAPVTSDTTPEMTWTSPSGGGGIQKVECRVDGVVIPDCAGGDIRVTQPLGDGEHTLTVKGSDTWGNETVQPAKFTVDTRAPEVVDLVWDAAARRLSFTATEAGATTTCSRGGDFTPCTSPWAPAQLAPGAHELTVRAVDAAGNAGQASLRVTIPQPPKDEEQPPPPPPPGTPDQGGTPPPNPGTGGAPAPSLVTPAPVTAPRTTTAASTKPAAKKKNAAKRTCRTVKTKKGKKRVCTTAKKKKKKKAKRKAKQR